MPAQVFSTVENNFTKGLITESTGLNFPENAATDTDNCIYTLVGDVTRRPGLDYEENYVLSGFTTGNYAYNTYKWDNAGGDGVTQIVVVQQGSFIYFYKSSDSTEADPLSSQLVTTGNIASMAVPGVIFDVTQECQFTDGNGFLFIFHPNCDPMFASYVNEVISVDPIALYIRDLSGVNDSLSSNTRPSTLSLEHNYNLLNQGWTTGSGWNVTSTTSYTNPVSTGSKVYTIPAGVGGITLGQQFQAVGQYQFGDGTIYPYGMYISGTVTAYSGTSLTLNVTAVNNNGFPFGIINYWTIYPTGTGYLSAWFAAEGNYPSNADVWWYFKNTSNIFDPATTANNVTLSVGDGPKGHFLFNAFSQDRSLVSGTAGFTNVKTFKRPTTGAWFQGRVWYSGVNDSFPSDNQLYAYNWTTNIYFSQIVKTSADFGKCYQTNDLTSENLFDILPTDGGVISIPQAGSIYKLFPIQNGLLVFASNGVWFITGSQGIGFSANDYTVVQLSKVKCISGTSFVDVLGLPYFWNEEGIYAVSATQTGSLTVNPITVGSILSFYLDIPRSSRMYARGSYDPEEYVITWIYRSVKESGISDRYDFDRMLNFNTYNKAFFPYTISNQNVNVSGINFVTYPSNLSPKASLKFFTVVNNTVTFSDFNDYTDWLDFKSLDGVGQNYESYFITGYKIRGQAIRKFQVQYIQMYIRTNNEVNGYKLQGIWDFAANNSSNKWSSVQVSYITDTRFNTAFKRHKIRGRGYALQFKVSSIEGKPFDIQGWAVVDTVNQGT